MISRLQGTLLEKHPPALLVDVQGVGYEVLVPMSTLFQLPDTGDEVILFTHFVVREDAQQLFGFVDKRDRELFRTLIRVNGVGPKMALAIMSGMDTTDLVRCVNNNDVAALCRIPGVGKKTAERLLVEMRDKLGQWEVSEEGAAASGAGAILQAMDELAEAESALVALGYKATEASRMVNAVAGENDGASSEELIRLALKSAVKA
jgi:Holliday junction DNA helicase RuvA